MEGKKVFISTGYYKNDKSDKIINKFYDNKIYDIELSGGKSLTNKDLSYLKNLAKNGNIRIHNYFPPPKNKFVINLASKNRSIIKKSLN